MMTRVALVHGILRQEERLLIDAFNSLDHVSLNLTHESELADITPETTDIAFVRSVSQTHAAAITQILEARGVNCLNSSAVVDVCGDKIRTASVLARHGIPQPEFRVAFSANEALMAIEEIGYPCVLKPPIGSWGRLLAKVHDRHAAEAIIEHKSILGGPQHHVFFVQAYVSKMGRDIRVFVAGNRAFAAIYRHSEHWITNTARGATVSGLPMNAELEELALRAAQAVGGGLLAIDLLESPNGYLVNEINDRMEFRNSIGPTGIDLALETALFVAQPQSVGTAT